MWPVSRMRRVFGHRSAIKISRSEPHSPGIFRSATTRSNVARSSSRIARSPLVTTAASIRHGNRRMIPCGSSGWSSTNRTRGTAALAAAFGSDATCRRFGAFVFALIRYAEVLANSIDVASRARDHVVVLSGKS